jgi:hypothetical protein
MRCKPLLVGRPEVRDSVIMERNHSEIYAFAPWWRIFNIVLIALYLVFAVVFGAGAVAIPLLGWRLFCVGVSALSLMGASAAARAHKGLSTDLVVDDSSILATRDGNEVDRIPWNSVETIVYRRAALYPSAVLHSFGGGPAIRVYFSHPEAEKLLNHIADKAEHLRPGSLDPFSHEQRPHLLKFALGAAPGFAILIFSLPLGFDGLVFTILGCLWIALASFLILLSVRQVDVDSGGISVKRLIGSRRYSWFEVNKAILCMTPGKVKFPTVRVALMSGRTPEVGCGKTDPVRLYNLIRAHLQQGRGEQTDTS